MSVSLLKVKRLEQGFTQDDVAGMLEITPTTYKQKEKFPSLFKVKEAQALRKILQLSMEDIEKIFFAS